MTVVLLVIIAVISYLLGGVNGAIISSKYFWKKDIRDYGSGNAGLTNFFRIFGVAGILLVIAIDVLKSVIAVLIGSALMGIQGENLVGKLFAGFCLMLGHVYPVFFQFRGGKAVLCLGIISLMVDWRVGIICWLIFALVVIFTKYVSLGSIIGAVFFPICIWAFGYTGLEATLSLICALIVLFKHRDNIIRLLKGKEAKFNIGKKSGQKFDD
ncbi:MAG TPA: glycerol-3-phosphate 1-O-acyltransferase PlsY [Clostridiales bacterium]|nr:glycerol-3-phosphate 1-O-acyltransferase PlsY [Clostridiales bacterium]